MTNINAEKPATDIDEGPGPWQFSLRSLLIAVTVASILLAIGVHFGGILVALAAVGVSQAGMLLSADWLIRPAHRRALAFVTAASWALIGSTFVIGAVAAIDRIVKNFANSAFSWSVTIVLFVAGALSFYVAKRRWQQLTVRR
jgi:hypothetical protein